MDEAEAFVGTWKIISVENEENFAKAAGLPPSQFALAKAGQNKLRQSTEFEGSVVISKLSGNEGIPTIEERFKFGQQFDSRDLLGRPIKVTVTMDNGKWIEKRVGDKTLTINKVIDGDRCIVETECDGKAMKTIYEIC